MFRKMRRIRQQLPQEEALRILENRTSGVLALHGDDGYPYAVPLSYGYRDGRLYFHCAQSGHKLDAIRADCRASFCVIDQDQVVPEEYATCYRSVIAFGRVRILSDDVQRRDALKLLSQKYAHNDGQQEIDRFFSQTCLLEFTIEHLTGKEALMLTAARSQEPSA